MDESEARRAFGKAVVAEIDGREVLFRPLKPSEAFKLSKSMTASPDDGLELAFSACEAACVSDPDELRRLMDEFPLAFTGETGVVGELIRVAQGDARIRVKTGVSLWKKADRNPGLMAENLLAFKAYTGGDWGEKEFAGALTIAEWAGSTKGIFNLFLALIKALSKRK